MKRTLPLVVPKPAPTTRPKRITTVAAINKANALFWDYENLRDKAHLSDEERGRMLGYAAVGVRMKRLAALKGTRNSADARRAKVAPRDQKWRDVHASGKTAKQILLDQPKRRGKKNGAIKKVTLSQINRVLKGHTP